MFEDVLERLDEDDPDRPSVEVSYKTQMIAFNLMAPDQARRIARLLAESAGSWQRRLLATPLDDPRYEHDIPFAETTLAEIEAGLAEFASGGVPP